MGTVWQRTDVELPPIAPVPPPVCGGGGLDGDRDFVDLVGRMAGTRMDALDGICVRGLRQAEDVSGSGIGPGLHELHALVGLYVEIGLVCRSKRVSGNANHLCVNVHEPSHDQPPMVSTTPP